MTLFLCNAVMTGTTRAPARTTNVRSARRGCVTATPRTAVAAYRTSHLTSPSSSSSSCSNRRSSSVGFSARPLGRRGRTLDSSDALVASAAANDDGEEERSLAGTASDGKEEEEEEEEEIVTKTNNDDVVESDDDQVDVADVDNASSPLGDLISSPLFYVTFGIIGGVAIVRYFENAALLLSAFPIVGLTVLSKTDFGTQLEEKILKQRPALEAAAAAAEKKRAAARAVSPYYGSERPMYVPSAFSSDGAAYAPHLTGELPGDYGFDPLGLSDTPEKLDRAQELELLHARWAMLGVVGAVVPELLTDIGALPLAEPVWWKVGAAKLSGESLNYLGVGGFVIAGKQGVAVIAACQAVLMGGPEYARYVGIRSLEPVGVYLPGDKNYPGGAPFDPFKFSDDAEGFEWQRVAEIKHGRLAMVAMAACFAQAVVTRQGPVANVKDFLADPTHANVLSSLIDTQ